LDKARERRWHDGWVEIRHRQPACAVIDQRAVHLQKSDELLRGNAVIGAGGGEPVGIALLACQARELAFELLELAEQADRERRSR
jgi:hypothetical protein